MLTQELQDDYDKAIQAERDEAMAFEQFKAVTCVPLLLSTQLANHVHGDHSWNPAA